MIIQCISCDKKFQVDSDLIPSEGRNIQCGSCGHIWFFLKEKQNQIDLTDSIKIQKTEQTIEKNVKKIEKIINKKEKALVKYQKSNQFTFGNFISYIFVCVISFIALIIVLDTFKNPLSNIFPNLEFVLFSLFETIKDIILFINDLI